MSITLTRSSTENQNTPSSLTFDGWENFPQLPRKVIEVNRRVGSLRIQRQETGEESQETTSLVKKGFETYSDFESFYENLKKAMDPSTFYTLTAEDLTINNVMIVDVADYRIRKVKGISSPTSSFSSSAFWMLEITLVTKVDNGASTW